MFVVFGGGGVPCWVLTYKLFASGVLLCCVCCFRNHFGSRPFWLKVGSEILHLLARLAQSASLPPTMVWDQARVMGEGGGRHPAGGTAGPNSKPPPPAQGETELHRERAGIVLVGFTILLIALCAFLAKKRRREVGVPPPRKTALRQQIKAVTEEPVR